MNRNIASMCVSSHLRPIKADAPSGDLFQRNCKRKCEREGRNRMNEGFLQKIRDRQRARERENENERVREWLSVLSENVFRWLSTKQQGSFFFSFAAASTSIWRRVSSLDFAGSRNEGERREKVNSCSIWTSGGYRRAMRTNCWHVRREKTRR